jgi:transposase
MRRRVLRQYDDTFRQEAVALLKRTDRTLGAVAKDLGIPEHTLRYWYNVDMGKKRKRSRREGAPVDPAETVEEKLARLQRENARLQKKLGELELDRAILKKAVAFFAKENE